jgi:hypothetical protein
MGRRRELQNVLKYIWRGNRLAQACIQWWALLNFGVIPPENNDFVAAHYLNMNIICIGHIIMAPDPRIRHLIYSSQYIKICDQTSGTRHFIRIVIKI